MPSLLSAAPAKPSHQVGETKQFGGHSYRLNENHRWVREDKDQPGQKAPQAPKSPTAEKTTAGKSNDQTSGGDHAQRHAFSKSQLGSVQGPARGIMAALQEHPDVAAGGAIVTQDFSPEQAGALHQWISQNVGQNVGGGQAVDLGQGRMGFASGAGSVVVWPADASGKHQVKYTNQTGPVSRGMGGGQAADGGQQPGAAAAQPPTPPGTRPGQPGTPPGQQPPAAGENPFAPPAAAGAVQPGFEPSKATPEQLASASALTEKPAKPAPPSSPREAANQSKERLSAALAQWQDEVAGGLTPQGNARWRSYTAALRSIWSQHEKLAHDWERKGKGGGKDSSKAKQAADDAEDDGARPDEAAAMKNAPEAFKELSGMREALGEEAYQDAVKQLAGQGKPWERRESVGAQPQRKMDFDSEKQGKRNPPIAGNDKGEQWRHAEEVFKKHGIDPKTGKPMKAKVSPPTGFETPAQEQPPPPKEIEGSNQYKGLVKRKAEEWDMKPEDFDSLADDLHKELTEHYGQREAAKSAARKATGLSAADINRLENQGFDSGSQHKKIKQLDTIGRELASQYPALGWGRGREDESNDESDIDYAEEVWHLIREGATAVPSRTSADFIDHVEEYLRSQLKGVGSSGVAGGAAADDDKLSAVPFAKVRAGIVERYRKWLPFSNQRLTCAAN